MSFRSSAIIVLWLAISSVLFAEGMRTWTNSEGKKIEAEMLGANDTEVRLKMKSNGKEYKVPLNSLSAADQAYIKAEMAKPKDDDGPARLPMGFENWDDDWPKLISGTVSPEIEIAEEDEAGKRFVYRSPRYEYVCDVKLTKNVVKRFAVLFESTNDYVRELPLSMAKARQDKRHKILLFETQQSYMRNGCVPGSAGVYIPSKDVIMVPLTSLGVIKGAGGYRVDYDKGNKTLPHEILHQLTDTPYFAPGSMGWFTEGLAEYVAVTPYRSGKFMVRGNQSAIEEYVSGYGEKGKGGRALGKDIKVPDLQRFMMQSYASFSANGNFNYGIGLLVTYYYCHWDGDGDAKRLQNFLKALKQGKRGDDALKVLLDGRSWDEMEEEIAKAWRSRGIKLNFQ